jgi:glycosyltransferase involved in cell wall biosynthesis
MNHSLKICLISREYPFETGWGGIGTYTFQLAHGLAERGHQIHVISQSLDMDKEYKDKDVFVHRVAHKTFFYGKRFLKEFALRLEYSQQVNAKVRELIKKYKIDIVEAPNFSAEAFIYSLSKKVPLVTRLHTHFSEVIDFVGWKRNLDFRLSCHLENTAILKSDLILCSTRRHAETISWETGIKKEKIEIIPLGIPVPEMNHKIPKNKNLSVLFVGRLEKRKGIQTLIQAIPFVFKRMPDVVFNVIGRDTFVSPDFVSLNGSEKESFKAKLVENLPREYHDRVNFLGHVDDAVLAQHYQSCDVFVAPSLYESFGLIYLEAMAYGKPVIGCGVGGVPEVIEDGTTGLLVPPEDFCRLAEAIIRLLKDPELRLALGQRARKYVEEHFSRDLMVEKTLDAYKRTLKGK